MRLLICSLLTVTIIAAMGTGWLLDQYYAARHLPETSAEHDQLIALAKHTIQLYNSSHTQQHEPDTHPNLSHTSTENHATTLETRINTIEEFPLPHSIMESLLAGKPLLLSSQNSFSLHLYDPISTHIFSFEFDHPTQNDNNQQLILTLLFYLGVTTIMALWLTPLIKRLLIIRHSLRRFGNGELNSRIPESRWSYIQEIEHGFNAMALRIETLVEDNKLLSRAVSHDLRTPIARLRFGVEVLQETPLTTDQSRHLDHIERDLEEMESLVETLLNFAKLETNANNISKKPFNVSVFLNKYLKHNSKPPKHKPPIQYDLAHLSNDTTVFADPTYITLLLNNLLHNAEKYATSRVRISSVIPPSRKQIRLTIEDDGRGIEEENINKVLLPFYREAESLPGHGMGLAIVSKIAEWHSIDFKLDRSDALGGLRVTLDFTAPDAKN